jgi:predicted AlkP superfamily phosphohydrolase/phosphomutase
LTKENSQCSGVLNLIFFKEFEMIKKVIVIGLDGFEPKIVEQMLAGREMPNLARLQEGGGYSRINTTYPAQTPVAWATFSTGTNPGKHGVFDFIRRDPKTYLPDLSLNRYEQKNAFLPPKVINLRNGVPVWELLSNAGIPSCVLRCPCTYPPDKIRGRMLSGMGVPDLRGGLGTSTFYSSDQSTMEKENENMVPVQPDDNGIIKTYLIGPRNPKTRKDLQIEITLQIDQQNNKGILRSDGKPKVLELNQGEWSDWLKVRFKSGLLQSIWGIVRFYLVRLSPVFELYASPINFDPDAPLFPISAPQEYAGDLAAELGTFFTTGMIEDHNGLNNERFDEHAFWDHCNIVMHERERMMLYELDRFDEGLFYCLFDTPDRVQHMFWRFREIEHPANKGNLPIEMTGVVGEHYRKCDEIVGKALNYADDQTLFVVLSDHGMSSFQRGVHLNSWLYENEFLALKNGLKPGDEAGDFFRSVDWRLTQAYAVGLGGIYLNVKGREGEGILDIDEISNVKAKIVKGLTGLKDPERNKTAIRSVVTREQVYWGAYADQSPDLLVNFSEGYRVSWGTALGGIPNGIFEDNIKKWSGDHSIDPLLVPGVLFMNKQFHRDSPSLTDMALTIVQAFGVPRSPAMEGRSLLI